ncbi:MAG: DUF3179 domain-containing protein [Dehalococcoidia bacterium]
MPLGPRTLLSASLALLLAGAVACTGGDGAEAPAATAVAPSAASTDGAQLREGAGPPLSAAEQVIARQSLSAFPLLDPTLRSIDLTEIDFGGRRDEIPALINIGTLSQDVMDRFLVPDEPVISVEINGEARAYPVQILLWHEIVNDTVGGVPVLVSYCPLCNSAIVFDRRVAGGEARTFGVSGLLRMSDLIMYDHQTESLWQQISGEAIVGADVGRRLTFLPSQTVSWQEFRDAFPEGLVLSINTGYVRNYGGSQYTEYDKPGTTTFFPFEGADDDRLDAKERVLAVEIDGDTVAFPFSALAEHIVLEAVVGGQPVVAFWQPGTRSVLDRPLIAESADVGAAAAYSPEFDGRRLSFVARDGAIVDTQTGSTWSVLGRAIAGPLRGAVLTPVVAGNHFWFAWIAFEPETWIVDGTDR